MTTLLAVAVKCLYCSGQRSFGVVAGSSQQFPTGTLEMLGFVLSTVVTLKLHCHMADPEFALKQG
jgi:hypothetical protein